MTFKAALSQTNSPQASGTRWALRWAVLLCVGCLRPLSSTAQPADDQQARGYIIQARALLQAQQPPLTGEELERAAAVMGRSNYLARAIEEAFQGNDLTNAARLVKEFPGSLDGLRVFGQPLVYQAACYGTAEQLTFLLEHKADPNLLAGNGESALTQAIRLVRWREAMQLVEAGADVTRTNRQGQAPLGLLIEMWQSLPPEDDPRSKLGTLLLAHGADPFAPMGGGEAQSILERALEASDEALCLPLLTNRPSASRRTPGGDTALHLAARWGLTNAIDFLLAAGFSANQTNSDGLTPLQCLADSIPDGSPQRRRYFGMRSYPGSAFYWGGVSSGAGPRSQPNTQPSSADVAEFLLSHGATLDVFSAAGLGKTNELAALLHADPALVKARDGFGRTPLHYAVHAADQPASLAVGGRAVIFGRPRQYPVPPSLPSTNVTCAALLLLRAGADPSAASARPARTSEPPMPAGTTPLHLAARRGNWDLLSALLQAGAAVAAADQDGNTALHLAASQWQTNCLALLIAARAPLDVTNHVSTTALQSALGSGYAANVELLFQAGARPEAGLGSNTLMHLAAAMGRTEMIPILLRHGLALEARDGDGRTPFQRAATSHQWSMVELLRAKRVNLNAADAQGNTALHLLAAQQNEDAGHEAAQPFWRRWERQWLSRPGVGQQTLQLLLRTKLISPPPAAFWTNTSLTVWLLEHGAKPNLTNHLGQTPLHVLCSQSWLAYSNGKGTNRIASLLKAGAKLDQPDARGQTALELAVANAPPEVLAWLLPRAGRLDAIRDAQGRTLLHQSILHPHQYHREQDQAILQTLLANHINPNLADTNGLTPLHLAVQTLWPNDVSTLRRVIPLLLANGADPNLPDKQGRTPLHLLMAVSEPASFYAIQQLIEVLQDRRWNYTARDHTGQTPLHLLAANANPANTESAQLLRSLLTNKALVNLTNGAGDTPLHVAIRAGRTTTVSMLLDAGANPAQRNVRGETGFRLVATQEPYSQMNAEARLRPTGANAGFFRSIYEPDQACFDRWLEADPGIAAITNANGQTPLIAATERGLTNFAQRLIELGAPVDLRSAMRLGRWDDFQKRLAETRGNNPPDLLFEAVDVRPARALRDLINAGGDVRAVNVAGHSLLYVASVRQQPELADWLRAQGSRETVFDGLARGDRAAVEALLDADTANVNCTNREGRTPLLYAASANNEELVALLLERGARADIHTGDRWSALHIAAAKNAVGIGRRLLAAGLDANELPPNGMGPLHLAAAYGYTNFAELLLQHGARISLRPPAEAQGFCNTPLHWAACKGYPGMVKWLLDHGADPKAINGSRKTPAELVRFLPLHTSWSFNAPPGAPPPYAVIHDEATRTEILELLDGAEGSAAK